MLALKHSLNVESKQIIYVDQNATGSGTGKSWANACTTIQAGLNAASDGTGWIVKIAPGTYYIPATLEPYPNTTISGSGRNLTIIDGSNNKRGFNCYTHRASNCNFEHLTIQNCNAGTNKVISNQDYSRNGAAIFGWGNGRFATDIGIGATTTSRLREYTGGYLYDCRFYNTNSPYSNNYSVGGCLFGFRWVINCIFDNTRCFNSPGKCWRYFGCVFCNTSIGHNSGSFGTIVAGGYSKNYKFPLSDIGVLMNCSYYNLRSTSNQTIVGLGGESFCNCLFFNMGNYYFDNNSWTATQYASVIPFESPANNSFRDATLYLRNSANPAPSLASSVGTLSSNDAHLISNSPCINAGTTQYLSLFDDCPVDWTVDLDGNKRIRNGQIDVGAYAYIG